ncbi:MAG: ABC transporter permease [Peptococcaceae bacterium]|jgi:oligopeptide transport system permease protein|nr:ABC transporter permease [Peptococcaceae bacterium]
MADFTPIPKNIEESNRSVRVFVSYGKDAWNRLKKNKVAVASLVFIIFVILFGFAGSVFFPNYTKQNLLNTFAPPGSPGAPLGTDELGRDLLSRLVRGTKISISIGLTVATINIIIGSVYGGIAGYFGGAADMIMMRIVDIVISIPEMIILILLLTIISKGMPTLILALCLTGWTGTARLVRGQVLQLREQEYILSARVLGAGKFFIILRHLLPNAIDPIIVRFAMSIPGVIFAEAFLSYIGLGVSIPDASWGNLAQVGSNQFPNYLWLFFMPATLFSLTMLAFNLLGDGLRDALDPKQRW